MIPLADWRCSPKEREYVNKVLDSGQLTYGPWCKRLEDMWALYHGCIYGVVNSSGTAALQLAFRACKELYKWDNDSEVICPAITFPATINMVVESGLKPVLCDVSLLDGMIDCQDLEKRITPKTKAVCVVHMWGTPYPRIAELLTICKKHNLKIIEDSCETIDKNVGHWGEVSCFSQYFNHIISAGVGGMACTNNPILEDIMRSLANHGMADTKVAPKFKRFHFTRIGYSMRITELEAALGVAQFERIDEILAKRREIKEYLAQCLEGEGVGNYAKIIGGSMMFPVLFTGKINLEKYLTEMDRHGIETRTAMPITNQPAMKPFVVGEYPNADKFNKGGCFFPIHPYMTGEHCRHIGKVAKWRIGCCL